MKDRLLVADEIATLLNVGKQRVYELVRTGKIPVIKIGERQYRFSREVIDRWIQTGGMFYKEENPNDE